jgi:flagellar biogenesis protein FliO
MFFESLKGLSFLVGFVSIGVLTLKICHKSGAIRQIGKKHTAIQIIERKKISAKADVVLIKFRETHVLLGVSGERLTLIMKDNTQEMNIPETETICEETKNG